MDEYKYQDITGQIINAAHTVHNTLGYGFLEKVYHNALVIELNKKNLKVESEKQYNVYYDNKMAGEFFADIVVDKKATDKYVPLFEAQLLNYLKVSGLEVGLILNFGPSVQVKRMVL